MSWAERQHWVSLYSLAPTHIKYNALVGSYHAASTAAAEENILWARLPQISHSAIGLWQTIRATCWGGLQINFRMYNIHICWIFIMAHFVQLVGTPQRTMQHKGARNPLQVNNDSLHIRCNIVHKLYTIEWLDMCRYCLRFSFSTRTNNRVDTI